MRSLKIGRRAYDTPGMIPGVEETEIDRDVRNEVEALISERVMNEVIGSLWHQRTWTVQDELDRQIDEEAHDA